RPKAHPDRSAMTPRAATAPPRLSPPARFGPLAVVLVAIGMVAALASTGRAGDSSASSGGDVGAANARLPIYWGDAEEDGTTADLDWGDRCVPETGRVRVPSVYAPPCAVARPGVEGGATHPGVTADTITVVLYQPADDVLSAVPQAQADP